MLVRRRHVRIEIEQKTVRICTAALVDDQDQTRSSPAVDAVEVEPLPSSELHILPFLTDETKD